MAGISAARKRAVLSYMNVVRETTIDKQTVVGHNCPIWFDDVYAAKALVKEGILADDPNNDDEDCFGVGPNFQEGLKKYSVIEQPVSCCL